jgi:hypothetical protein
MAEEDTQPSTETPVAETEPVESAETEPSPAEAQTETDSPEKTGKEEGDEELDGEDGGDEDDTAQEPVKPVGRAQARIQKLSAERDAERADKERLIHERAIAQAQLEHLRAQQRDLQSAAERKAEEDRLSLLDPQERAVYQANQQIRNLEYRLNQMEIQRTNDQDRANFHAKATHDETYGKYADEVEKMYQEGLSRGVSASREDLHSYILGKELKKDLATKVSKKKESANKRIDSVTSKSASARGDVTESKKGKSLEERLRGVQI